MGRFLTAPWRQQTRIQSNVCYEFALQMRSRKTLRNAWVMIKTSKEMNGKETMQQTAIGSSVRLTVFAMGYL
jgi:hypothetical protein